MQINKTNGITFRQDWHENKNNVILKLCRQVCSELTEFKLAAMFYIHYIGMNTSYRFFSYALSQKQHFKKHFVSIFYNT